MKSFFVAALAVVALVAAGTLRAEDKKPELKCPVSGGPAKEANTVDFNGGKVAFCCDKCPAAFKADEKKFAAKANLQLVQSKQLKQVSCPLTGRPVAADKNVEVAGVEVGLCCAGCQGKAKKASGDELIALLFTSGKGFEPVKK